MTFRLAKVVVAACAGVMLAACTSVVSDAENRTPSGTPFENALYNEYMELAQYEQRSMWDWRDAGYFAERAIQTAEGNPPPPQDPASRRLSQEWLDQIVPARGWLMESFDAGSRENFPNESARAQAGFDCWLEQAEEGVMEPWQPQDIIDCRRAFFDALAVIYPQPEAAPPPAQPTAIGPWVLYFDFDRSNISYEGQLVINEAADSYSKNPGSSLVVMGHTDRAGTEQYNLGLSARRAGAVEETLVLLGVDQNDITVSALGESKPAVPTADGVREPLNRRVEIQLVR